MERCNELRLADMVRDVMELVKVRQTLLLLVGMIAGIAIAAKKVEVNYVTVLEALVIGFVAIAATTAINMYFDADIDAVMERTRNRPIPSGRVDPRSVLLYALLFFTVSAAASTLLLNKWFTFWLIMGFAWDILAYTIALKRRTWVNIFAGSVAGAAPVLGGYSVVSGQPVSPESLIVALLIVAWIPSHIWLLTIHYIDDYRKAGVPMLPVVMGLRAGLAGVALSIASTMVLGILGVFLNILNPILVAIAVSLSLTALILLPRCKPSRCKLHFRLVNVSLAFYLLSALT